MLPKDIRTVTCPPAGTKPPSRDRTASAARSCRRSRWTVRCAVASESDAEVVLEVTLNRFWLDPVAYEGAAPRPPTVPLEHQALRPDRRADRSVFVESPSVTGWYDFDFAATCPPPRPSPCARREDLGGASSARSSNTGLEEGRPVPAKRIIPATTSPATRRQGASGSSSCATRATRLRRRPTRTRRRELTFSTSPASADGRDTMVDVVRAVARQYSCP
jgi:hypothetical protein